MKQRYPKVSSASPPKVHPLLPCLQSDAHQLTGLQFWSPIFSYLLTAWAGSHPLPLPSPYGKQRELGSFMTIAQHRKWIQQIRLSHKVKKKIIERIYTAVKILLNASKTMNFKQQGAQCLQLFQICIWIFTHPKLSSRQCLQLTLLRYVAISFYFKLYLT